MSDHCPQCPQNGDWTDESAERLVEEDGRFFYLMARSGTCITPPTVIDKVWHIHLAMGDDFESRFCKEFGVKMTHETGMARGDALALYARGYEAYADEFSDQPPKDIWPSPWKQRNERFLTTIFHIGFGTFAAGCAIGIFFVLAIVFSKHSNADADGFASQREEFLFSHMNFF